MEGEGSFKQKREGGDGELQERVEMCSAELLSRVRLFAIPWTVARQAPLSMEFSRQEYWSMLPFPSPGALPHPGIKSGSPVLQVDSLPAELPGS